jgi:hypothetical protein
MKKRKPTPKNNPELASILDKLSRPKESWENYLRQKHSGTRYTLDMLIDAAQDMENGGDFKARYCAGMAYAEAGMRLSEGYYLEPSSLENNCRLYGEKARGLLVSSINQAESPKDYLDINLRKICLDLYKIPISAKLYNIESVYETQQRVVNNIDREILAINTLLSTEPLAPKERAWLVGAANEYSVLRTLQSDKLVKNGLVAIPSFPWEEDGIKNTTMHTKIVRQPQNGGEYEKNTNYDIALVDIFDPYRIVQRIQVKTSFNFTKIYEDNIAVINSSEIVQKLTDNAPEQHRFSNSLSFYLFQPNEQETQTRIDRATDIILQKCNHKA